MFNWLKDKLKLCLFKIQSRPSLNDVENEKVVKLARGLKCESKRETLVNILEWQDRNIGGWVDRWYVFLVFYIFLLMSYLILISVLRISFSISVVFLVILSIAAILNLTYLISVSVPLFLYFSYIAWLIAEINPKFAITLSKISTTLAFLFGGMITVFLYLVMKYTHFNPKCDSNKLRILLDIFRFTLPAEQIINYRLAVCKDYAKLTASLLFNIFPNSRVYFIGFFSLSGSHIAAAVKINDKYYVLDQKLPVLTINGWMRRWKRKNADVYVSELLKDSEGNPAGIAFSRHEKIVLSYPSEVQVNTEKLTEEVSKLLEIPQTSEKEKPDFEICMQNFALYYEDDEIVIYSMARAIKLRLENELCSNFENIEKIEINQNGSDLIVLAYLRQV